MTARKKILVVDDDDAVTTYLRAKLGSAYEVVTTNVSTRALALAKSENPDLVICDVDMPQLDGGDLAAKLASDPSTRGIQLLFLTGLLSPEEAAAVGGQVAGHPAIAKRAPLGELLGRIEQMIG
jgi:two-component system sensor histidine kinase/response regulator